MARIALIFLLLAGASPAFADRIRDSIVAQLHAQGFTRIEISRTFLGRSRIVARSKTLDREIIFNPMTGVIMRDYSTARDDASRPEVTIVDPEQGRTGGTAAASVDKAGDDGSDSSDSGEGDNGGPDSGDGDGGGTGDSGGDDGGDSGDSGGGDTGDGGSDGGSDGAGTGGSDGGSDGGDGGGSDGGDGGGDGGHD